MLIFTILCTICFIYYLVKEIKDNLNSSKNMDKKLYCHDCKMSYTDAPEYKYCPLCGKELQYLDSEENNDSFNKEV